MLYDKRTQFMFEDWKIQKINEKSKKYYIYQNSVKEVSHLQNFGGCPFENPLDVIVKFQMDMLGEPPNFFGWRSDFFY